MKAELLVLTLLASLVPVGCSSSRRNDDETATPPTNDDSTQMVIDDDVIVAEPGSNFETAPLVPFDAANRMVLDNEISEGNEVHVYDLGPLEMGDRLEILAIDKAAQGLDPMIAVFDAEGFRSFWNDDINPNSGNFDAFFDGVIRHDSPSYFLAVASSNFSMTTGTYRVTVEREPGVAIAPLIGQTIVLHWDPAQNVTISDIKYGDLDEINSTKINSSFVGRTEEMKEIIIKNVAQDFAPYDIEIMTTDEEIVSPKVTNIFFGDSTTLNIFGISDAVDFYNNNDQDNAIVFLGSFEELSGNFNEVCQAVANVVSHEIGHTLGLMHTADSTTIMDTTGEDVTLLEDQGFGTAPLFDFPIGLQNADMLLSETVGRVTTAVAEGGHLRCGTCGATIHRVRGR